MLNEFIQDITKLQSDFEEVKKLKFFFEHGFYMLALQKAWNLPNDTLTKESFIKDVTFFMDNWMHFYIEDLHYFYLKSEVKVFSKTDYRFQLKSYDDFKKCKIYLSSLQHETSKT